MRRGASAVTGTSLVVLCALLMASCGSAASTQTSSHARRPAPAAALTVTPRDGNPATVFLVELTGVAPTPAPQGEKVGLELGFRGSGGAQCVGAGSLSLPHTVGTAVAATLSPSHFGGHWCPGTYLAKVQEIASAKCAPGAMCPQFVRVIRTVAVTRFRVTG